MTILQILQIQCHLYHNSTIVLEIKDHVSIQSNWNARKYCWKLIDISLTERMGGLIERGGVGLLQNLNSKGGWGGVVLEKGVK